MMRDSLSRDDEAWLTITLGGRLCCCPVLRAGLRYALSFILLWIRPMEEFRILRV